MPRLLASWFGTGLILRRLRDDDGGSGTLGALLALVVALLLAPLGWVVQLAATAVVTGLSVWSAGHFAADGDPGWVVVDEAAGTLLATIGLGVPAAIVAFVVFRIADITKRLPGVAAGERLPGGWGITADDLAAGGWALAAGWIVEWLF